MLMQIWLVYAVFSNVQASFEEHLEVWSMKYEVRNTLRNVSMYVGCKSIAYTVYPPHRYLATFRSRRSVCTHFLLASSIYHMGALGNRFRPRQTAMKTMCCLCCRGLQRGQLNFGFYMQHAVQCMNNSGVQPFIAALFLVNIAAWRICKFTGQPYAARNYCI